MHEAAPRYEFEDLEDQKLRYLIRLDGTFAAMNDFGLRILGYSRDELIDSMARVIMRPDENTRSEPEIERAYAEAREHPGTGVQVPAGWFETKSRRRVWVNPRIVWLPERQAWLTECEILDIQPPHNRLSDLQQQIELRIEERLLQILDRVAVQARLPGMPAGKPRRPRRDTRKYAQFDALTAGLHHSFDVIGDIPDAEPTLELTAANFPTPISANTLRARLLEQGFVPKGSGKRDYARVLRRLFDEYHKRIVKAVAALVGYSTLLDAADGRLDGVVRAMSCVHQVLR